MSIRLVQKQLKLETIIGVAFPWIVCFRVNAPASATVTSRKHVFLQRCGVWMLCCAGYPALSSPVRSFKLVRRVDSLPPSCLLLRMSLKMIWATRTRFYSSLSLAPESKGFSRKTFTTHYITVSPKFSLCLFSRSLFFLYVWVLSVCFSYDSMWVFSPWVFFLSCVFYTVCFLPIIVSFLCVCVCVSRVYVIC